MSASRHEFQKGYGAGFEQYVVDRTEVALQRAYELGREAVRRELSVLDLATIHHDVLVHALSRASGPSEIEATARAAEEFFVESLSSLEMVQRGYREAQEAALAEQRNTAILRQLSNFLTDASLAMGTDDAIGEVLQLLAEHAREVLEADVCTVTLHVNGLEAASGNVAASGDSAHLIVPLASLGGDELGSIDVAKREGGFSGLDGALLVHLAQTASAAIERARLYAAPERRARADA